MAKKKQKIDMRKYSKYLAEQQNIKEFMESLKNLTGRELYDLDTYSLMNKFLIDRPIEYALHRARINYQISPMETMKTCLLDGAVYIRVEDADHIRIEKNVFRGKWDVWENHLTFVEIRFVFTRNGADFTHIEQWAKTDTGSHQTIFHPVRGTVVDKTKLKISFEDDFPYFPFVSILWVDGESFLEPLSDAVIRLEAAFRVIGVENTDRLGAAIFLENVRNLTDIKTAPAIMGRRIHSLPKGGKFHSVGSDAPGIQLMLTEIENLISAIEKASGVVSTEKLASLSGISRMIAENPLMILSDEIRSRFRAGMELVVETARIVQPSAPELKLKFKTIKFIVDTDKHIKLIDRAKLVEAITPEEEILELRMLLDLE